MKKFALIIMIMLGFTLYGCQSDVIEEVTNDPTNSETIYLTLEELAYYDGLDDRPAYIAVDGVIYDVSDSSRWVNGSHNGYQAGTDLTQAINSSPHGKSTLSRMPIIGYLKSGS